MNDSTTRDPRNPTPSDRFWKYVTPGPFTDCWDWTGALRNGYGVLNIDGKVIYAHRFSFELHYGPLPEGQCVLHKCDRRACCSPYHLFAGTKGDNNRDAYAKGRGNTKAKVENGGPKLSDDQVREIRQLAAQGIGYTEIMKRFGIGRPMVSLIVNRKRRSHLP